MNKNKLLSTSGLIIALALLLGINLVSGLFVKNVKLDLTENRLYTLSKGTENILSDLQEPLTLRLYFSEKHFTGLPGVLNYGNRVKDLLEEYVALSKGKLTLAVADPEPFSETEDEAVEYGLQGVPVDATGNQAYFGLVGINAAEKREVIPFLQPDKEESLEYDVTRMVYSLANPKRKVVGLISSLPMSGMAANPFMSPGGAQQWMILKQLEQSFEVKSLSLDVMEIPDDVDVLMVVHPKELSDRTLLGIDQYVLGGGRLIAFVDPFSEADQPMTNPSNPMAAMQASRNSSMKKLFDAWGVELAEGKIAADKPNAQQVQVQMGGRIRALDYVAWLSFGKEELNSSDFVTRDLEKVSLATAGYFTKKTDTTTEIVPLIETSNRAMPVESMQFQFGANPEQLLRKYTPGDQKLNLALRLSGKVKTAFPDGITVEKAANTADETEATEDKTEKKAETETIAAAIKASSESINVILVADTDMLEDKHWVRVQNFFGNRIALPHSNNDVFLLNAIENLSGSNDLISLRSRTKAERSFTRVLELKQEAEKRFQDKERALQTKLEETERKLAELQQQKGGTGTSILTAEQEQEIEGFRSEQVQTRKELRNVQHELVKSIESLGTVLKAINIALMPLLVIVFAIVYGVMRKRQLASAYQ